MARAKLGSATTTSCTMSAGKRVTPSFEGIILSKTDITLQTGATMKGRALAQTQVALQQATVTQPAP